VKVASRLEITTDGRKCAKEGAAQSKRSDRGREKLSRTEIELLSQANLRAAPSWKKLWGIRDLKNTMRKESRGPAQAGSLA